MVTAGSRNSSWKCVDWRTKPATPLSLFGRCFSHKPQNAPKSEGSPGKKVQDKITPFPQTPMHQCKGCPAPAEEVGVLVLSCGVSNVLCPSWGFVHLVKATCLPHVAG